ncbi:photosystem reaction center subunit H [Halobiforma lacisalsi AJ5]|uniref:PRC-barrel domain-containing protein n=3 Tax=Natrialbaceae TaxID=1644061 RepID=M0LFB2_NATLA|nr:photosystem reaction center subunit H [Halobiforma lacisalsi AJ5]EMA32277.1 PRC-barrel domain-containing protein [Halobiforma lacisalsi AJ5]SFC32720.1 Sporulation protein YlmC, PRC-barrel domain family [Halobiforma haloterrestris]
MVELDDTPQEITSLVGREVYSNSGVFVGEVEDLQLNVDGEAVTGLALGSLNAELFQAEAETGQGVIVPYRWVRAVGDVILVNDVVERVRDPDEQESELVA